MPSMSESMKDYIQINLHSIGISIINDRDRDDLFYITINPSKELWTETRKFHVRPLGPKLNQSLEESYKKYLQQNQDKSNKQQIQNKFKIDKTRVKFILNKNKKMFFFKNKVCIIQWRYS
jgi:hypothetical protein